MLNNEDVVNQEQQTTVVKVKTKSVWAAPIVVGSITALTATVFFVNYCFDQYLDSKHQNWEEKLAGAALLNVTMLATYMLFQFLTTQAQRMCEKPSVEKKEGLKSPLLTDPEAGMPRSDTVVGSETVVISSPAINAVVESTPPAEGKNCKEAAYTYAKDHGLAKKGKGATECLGRGWLLQLGFFVLNELVVTGLEQAWLNFMPKVWSESNVSDWVGYDSNVDSLGFDNGKTWAIAAVHSVKLLAFLGLLYKEYHALEKQSVKNFIYSVPKSDDSNTSNGNTLFTRFFEKFKRSPSAPAEEQKHAGKGGENGRRNEEGNEMSVSTRRKKGTANDALPDTDTPQTTVLPEAQTEEPTLLTSPEPTEERRKSLSSS